MFEIVDNDGTIYSGSEDYVRSIWETILEGKSDLSWDGDLKLVKVLDRYL